MLKKGNTGLEVTNLQSLLGVAQTGYFGEDTFKAVVAVQKRFGLIADGIAGPKTLAALKDDKKDLIKLLTMVDIKRAADELQVEEAVVIAVHKVESVGTGFLPDGRAKILYERHQMYKQLNKIGENVELLMKRYPAIINTARGGYLGNSAEYGRLALASQINVDCALESCSWGAYQIMGYHWKVLGYESVQNFVLHMHQSEGAHLNAFVKYIQADSKLHTALKAKKWADFAKIYNGPAYRENFYDAKLASAYETAKNSIV